MSSLVINDIFERLREENKCLFNELLICNKILSEIKSFIEYIFEKYENTFDANDCHCCEKLAKEAEEVLARDKTFREFNSFLKQNQRSVDESEEQIECEITLNETKDKWIEELNQKKTFEEIKEEAEEYYGSDSIDGSVNDKDSEEEEKTSESNSNKVNQKRRILRKKYKPNVGQKSKRSSFRCSYDNCLRFYSSELMLKSHYNSHTSGVLKCFYEGCDKVYETETKLSKHLFYHKIKEPENRRKYGCDWPGCDYRDCNRGAVNKHKLYVHTPDSLTRKYLCTYPGCGKSWKSQGFLNAHMKTHKVEEVMCDMCDRVFKNKESMVAHRTTTHIKDKNITCDYPGCQFRCVYESQLNTHKVWHTDSRPFICTVDGCDKRFHKEHHLKDHIESHSTERKFKCLSEECNKMFKTEAYMKAHYKQTHLGLEYRCDWPGCDRGFVSQSHVEVHINAVHKKLRPYVCPLPGCDHRFATISNMNQHMKTHSLQPKSSAEKKHHCDWPGCNYATDHNQRIKEHILMHTNEKPFSCDHPGCDFRTRTEKYLSTHSATHSSDRPFMCPIRDCGKRFKTNKGVHKHKKFVHKMDSTNNNILKL